MKAKVQVDDIAKTYGDVDPEFTYTATGVREGDALSIGFEREPGEDAGEYVVRPVLLDDPESNNENYNVELVSGTLTIEPKDVTVMPLTQRKVVCTADPVLTAQVDGLVGDDEISYQIKRAPGEFVGTYPTWAYGDEYQGGADGKNYHVVYNNPGTFTIEWLRPVCATYQAHVQTYGWLDPVSHAARATAVACATRAVSERSEDCLSTRYKQRP